MGKIVEHWVATSLGERNSGFKLDRTIVKYIYTLVGDELFSTLQPISHRRDVASFLLLYRYSHGVCSDELSSFVPPLLNFTAKTRCLRPIVANHPNSLRVSLVRCKFH